MSAASYSPVARNLRAGSPVPGRPLIGAGLGLAASMLALGAALLIARTIYLNSVPASASADAAAAAFDIALRIGAVALAAILFVFWGQPTAAVVVAIAVLLLVVLGLIEVIGRPPAQPSPAPHALHGRAMPLSLPICCVVLWSRRPSTMSSCSG